jgi:hypothetical protein
MHRSIDWTAQQRYGQSAPATMPAELSSWKAPGMSDYPMPLRHRQAYPSTHGEFSYPEMHAGGACIHPNMFHTLSTGVASGLPPHLSKESPSYTALDATIVTLTPSTRQVTSTTVANAMGNSIAAPPGGTANPTGFSVPQMSKTKTGRNASKRGLPGRMFERNLEKVQERLRSEGADIGAVERLGSEIFLDGNITKTALKTDMTLDQRRTREGKQKYMLLLEVVLRPHSSHVERDHCCLLCPPWARAEFKNREDSLRHFHKDHLGLSFDCGYW